MSRPIYFPPPPFVLADALTCAQLVINAYDMETQWAAQGKPRQSDDFQWTLPTGPGAVSYSAPIWSAQRGPLHLLSKNEPFGFVAWTAAGTGWLVFRGTESAHDWLIDAESRHVDFDLASGWGTVHHGFMELYQAVRDSVHAAFAQTPRLQRVFVTGHSLGSGISTLALADLAANTQLPLAIHYNLASPRVGDPAFAGRLNGLTVPTYRIVNTEDVVTNVPPSTYGKDNFEHVGTCVTFTAQYGSADGNHSMSGSYMYTLEHPNAPASCPD